MRYPAVSIIILNFNGYKDTVKCLESLRSTKYPKFHVYVVDNGSKKNEAQLLQQRFTDKRFSYIRFHKNYGFTGGNNRMFQKIKNPYVVLLNNDTIVRPNWLTPIMHRLESNKKIAIVQPKILWLRRKTFFDYAGACGGFIDKLGYPYTKGRIFHTLEEDKGQYNQAAEILWASGAVMAIRMSALRTIGSFDESYFNYMEEIDLCYRALSRGYKIFCEPKSIVYHKVASTASRNDLKKRYWEHRNNMLFITKNFPLPVLFLIIPVRIMLEVVSALYYLLIKRTDFSFAVMLSLLYLVWGIPKTLVTRLLHTQTTKINIYATIPLKSIIFAYFFQNKKQFWQLTDVNMFIPRSLNFLETRHVRPAMMKSS